MSIAVIEPIIDLSMRELCHKPYYGELEKDPEKTGSVHPEIQHFRMEVLGVSN